MSLLNRGGTAPLLEADGEEPLSLSRRRSASRQSTLSDLNRSLRMGYGSPPSSSHMRSPPSPEVRFKAARHQSAKAARHEPSTRSSARHQSAKPRRRRHQSARPRGGSPTQHRSSSAFGPHSPSLSSSASARGLAVSSDVGSPILVGNASRRGESARRRAQRDRVDVDFLSPGKKKGAGLGYVRAGSARVTRNSSAKKKVARNSSADVKKVRHASAADVAKNRARLAKLIAEHQRKQRPPSRQKGAFPTHLTNDELLHFRRREGSKSARPSSSARRRRADDVPSAAAAATLGQERAVYARKMVDSPKRPPSRHKPPPQALFLELPKTDGGVPVSRGSHAANDLVITSPRASPVFGGDDGLNIGPPNPHYHIPIEVTNSSATKPTVGSRSPSLSPREAVTRSGEGGTFGGACANPPGGSFAAPSSAFKQVSDVLPVAERSEPATASWAAAAGAKNHEESNSAGSPPTLDPNRATAYAPTENTLVDEDELETWKANAPATADPGRRTRLVLHGNDCDVENSQGSSRADEARAGSFKFSVDIGVACLGDGSPKANGGSNCSKPSVAVDGWGRRAGLPSTPPRSSAARRPFQRVSRSVGASKSPVGPHSDVPRAGALATADGTTGMVRSDGLPDAVGDGPTSEKAPSTAYMPTEGRLLDEDDDAYWRLAPRTSGGDRQTYRSNGGNIKDDVSMDSHDSASQLFFEDAISLADSDLDVRDDTGNSPSELEASVPFTSSLGADFLSLFATS